MSGPDVIVIGAGVAGLTVARDLTAAGLRVLLLEARRRLGGRIMTHHTPDGPVELGAEFVHGAVEEILGVAAGAGLPLRETDRSAAPEPRGGSPPARTSSPPSTRCSRTLRAATTSRSSTWWTGSTSMPVPRRAAWGSSRGTTPPIRRRSACSRCSTTPRPTSGRAPSDSFASFVATTAWSPPCSSRRCASFAPCSSAPSSPPSHGGKGTPSFARPRARSSRRRSVVVTVPLGVLKAGAIDFSPRLPGKEDALRRLEMGAAARVSLQFEHDAWAGRDAFSRDGFLFTGEPPFPVWWISHPAPRPVVTGWAGGRHALALATLGETERVGAALEGLGAALGVAASRLRGELRGGFCHDWLSDPFARGAYSYAGVGGRHAGTELSAPVDSTLFFAGEATQSDGRNATVHGAIASGQRAAKQVLAALRGDPSS